MTVRALSFLLAAAFIGDAAAAPLTYTRHAPPASVSAPPVKFFPLPERAHSFIIPAPVAARAPHPPISAEADFPRLPEKQTESKPITTQQAQQILSLYAARN